MRNTQNKFSANEDIEGKLWEYLDGLATAAEKARIDLLLEQNNEWRKNYSELLEMQQLLKSSELEQPSLRFTKNVMEQIAMLHIAPGTKNYIDNNVTWSIASFFIITIAGFLIYATNQIDWSSGYTNTIAGVDLSQVDYTSVFNNTFVNVFMMINIVLGLMFLERYLSGRNKQLRTRAH